MTAAIQECFFRHGGHMSLGTLVAHALIDGVFPKEAVSRLGWPRLTAICARALREMAAQERIH